MILKEQIPLECYALDDIQAIRFAEEGWNIATLKLKKREMLALQSKLHMIQKLYMLEKKLCKDMQIGKYPYTKNQLIVEFNKIAKKCGLNYEQYILLYREFKNVYATEYKKIMDIWHNYQNQSSKASEFCEQIEDPIYFHHAFLYFLNHLKELAQYYQVVADQVMPSITPILQYSQDLLNKHRNQPLSTEIYQELLQLFLTLISKNSDLFEENYFKLLRSTITQSKVIQYQAYYITATLPSTTVKLPNTILRRLKEKYHITTIAQLADLPPEFLDRLSFYKPFTLEAITKKYHAASKYLYPCDEKVPKKIEQEQNWGETIGLDTPLNKLQLGSDRSYELAQDGIRTLQDLLMTAHQNNQLCFTEEMQTEIAQKVYVRK